jgi:uncharacterized protein (TIGR02271 family)
MANATAKIPGTTNATIAGLFQDESKAENAIEELRAAGFSDREIGVATPHEEGKTSSFWDKLKSSFGKQEHTEQANDLEQSLVNSRVPEQQARYFNSELNRGGVLVTVHAGPERTTQALSILQQNGADVGTAAAGWEGSVDTEGLRSQRIQLVGEILRVHKEHISRGEVRLRKEVVTETQNLEVPTTREELVMERIPGSGREATEQVGSADTEIRIPLSEERVRVEKKPVVNEEVEVGKRQVQDTKRVTDQVRHEELRTDTEGTLDDEDTREKTRDRTRKTA